jgi:hypothetical protein
MGNAFCRFSLARKLSRLFNIQEAFEADFLRSFEAFKKLSRLQTNEVCYCRKSFNECLHESSSILKSPFSPSPPSLSSPSLPTSKIFVLQPTKNIRKSCHRSPSSFNFFSLLARFQFLEITTTKKKR